MSHGALSSTPGSLRTPRGTMSYTVHAPDGSGPASTVVLFMDAIGIRPALHDHARRLARAGYRAVLPDLFYFVDPADQPDPERLAAGDEREFARMGALAARMDDEAVLQDTEALLQQVSPTGPWGCVGFCMGGRLGLRAAETPARPPVVACLLHPSGLVTDDADSPHRRAASITGALYLGFGEKDHVTPLTTIPPLREQLQTGGVEHRIDVLAGADHGFTMPGMPAYHQAAAEQAWAGTMDLLGDKLAPAADVGHGPDR